MNKLLLFFILFYAQSFGQNTINLVTNNPVRITINGVTAPTGNSYYVSSSYTGSTSNGQLATPFKTLAQVQSAAQSGTFKAGDNILFKCGDSWLAPNQTEGMHWWASTGCPSGTATNPITLSSYGTGAKPNFQFPFPSSVDIQEKICMSFYGVNYIVINGLDFTDKRFPVNDKTNPAYCSEAVFFGSSGSNSNYCTLTNTDMANIGNGVVINGKKCIISYCTMTDLKNIVNTAGGDDDYGANGLTLSGDSNYITHNYFKGNWAISQDYGFNGGAIEIFNSTNYNTVIYNTIVDCNGVAEFGSSNGGAARDNLFAYNKLVDNGMLTYCNISGTFAIQVYNTMYFNNTVVEDSNSRFTDGQLYKYNGSPLATTVFNLKNNIYQLSTGIAVVDPPSAAKTTHENNLYKLTNGSVRNYTLGASEANTTAPIWRNTTNSDASLWDYNLSTGSAAINLGQNVGILYDFNGVPLNGEFDAGILRKSDVLAIGTDPRQNTQSPFKDRPYYDYGLIRLYATSNGQFEVLDMLRRKVLEGYYKYGNNTIPAYNLSSGVYVFSTYFNNQKLAVIRF